MTVNGLGKDVAKSGIPLGGSWENVILYNIEAQEEIMTSRIELLNKVSV